MSKIGNDQDGKMRFGTEIKGVIFDIDGVLLDSMEIWTDLGARYVRSQGKEPEENLGAILFSMSMEEGAGYIRDHFLQEKTREEIIDSIQALIRDFYFYEVKAKPGAEKFMDALKNVGVRMTAATSSPREHVERALERNGLLRFISRIYTNSEVGSSKHSPEIYDIAAGSMGFDKSRICVLEDSLYALETAARAGYRTVGIYDEKGEPDQKGLEKKADVYVRDFAALMQMF